MLMHIRVMPTSIRIFTIVDLTQELAIIEIFTESQTIDTVEDGSGCLATGWSVAVIGTGPRVTGNGEEQNNL